MESGLAALQKSIEEAKSRPARRGGEKTEFQPRLNYFGWKDGEVKVVRFLTDDINQSLYAEYVLTKDGKSQNFIVDPDNNLVAKYGGKSRESYIDTSSPMIEPKLVKRAAGVAVLREERPGTGGKMEIVDHLYERSIGDTTYPSRYFGVIRQAIKNFWPTLVECAARYGTICDRDYVIKRIGGGLDTSYSILPCDPVDGLRTVEEVQAFYGYGKNWNAEDPERFLNCPQTIAEWVDYYGSEDRIKHWLGVDDAVSASFDPVQSFSAARSDEAQAAPTPSGTDFASLRERLIPHAQ
jgi:hypothetical protein